MRCETFLDRYDRLDSGEEVGFFLRLHLATCSDCRRAVERLDEVVSAWRRAEAAREASPRARAEADTIDARVMASIRLLPRPHRELHAGNWAVSGAVFFFSLAFIPFSADFDIFRKIFGDSYTLPLFLVFGLGLTVYGAVFIASHLEELEPLVKRFVGGTPRG
jgi:hypothetical protein